MAFRAFEHTVEAAAQRMVHRALTQVAEPEEADPSAAFEAAHQEEGSLASAALVAESPAAPGNSWEALTAAVAERSAAASFPAPVHPLHEPDQPDRVEPEPAAQWALHGQQLDQGRVQPWRRLPRTWHVTLQEEEGLRQSWR